MKTIEVNLGVGMNMLFPETVKIVIDDTFQKRYESYLEFVKTLEDVDYDYITDDPNEYKLREFIRSRVGLALPSALFIKRKFCCILKNAGANRVIAAKNNVSVEIDRKALLSKNCTPAISKVIAKTDASKIYLFKFIK